MAPEPTVVDIHVGRDDYLLTDYMLTTWSDGIRQLAVRPTGQSTWSPPITLEVQR
jgi:hypothetical protein